MRLNHQVIPPCGWVYDQKDVRLHGKTWDELLTAVITHRAENGINVGDPVKDIEDQIISKFPGCQVNQFRTVIHRGN